MNQTLKTKHSFLIRHAIILLVFILFTSHIAAQQITITGEITDALSKESLPGVNIHIKGTTSGVVTDVFGKYSIRASQAGVTLVFSYMGYLSQEIVVGDKTVIDVSLREDTKEIEEVVVVGYGVQRKATVTGAVASVSGAELKASPATNLSNGMLGKLPGVIGFSRSGEPGGGETTIRIRGTNSLGSKDPLVVIDGVPDRSGGFNRLNPNEIETISVLKDASAAIYGARAANGVILVTTKKGRVGKPTVSLQANYGYSNAIRLPEMCDAFEYATMLNEINPGTYSQDQLQKFQDGSDPWGYPNTNWYDETIKKRSPIYRVDLGIEGGSENFTYYVNLAANGEDGIYKNSANRYDQYSARVNLDFKVGKYVQFSLGNVGRIEDIQYPAKSASSIFNALRRGKPIYNAYWPTGEPAPDIEYGDNPAVTSTDLAGFDRQKKNYIQNNLTIKVEVPWVQGLNLISNLSFDKEFQNRKKFERPIYLYYWNGSTTDPIVTPSKRWRDDPALTLEGYDQTAWMANLVASYERRFNAHTFGVTVGTEAQSKQQSFYKTYRRYFTSDYIPEIDLGGTKDQETGGNSWKETRQNYFGRATYNYLEKYLVEFVWRVDGSYRFPENKRYGFFPGIMVAWRASEEPFWKNNLPFIEYFKLRASVSQTGNDALLDADKKYDRSVQYLDTFGGRTDNPKNYVFGTTEHFMIFPTRTPNMDITWEVGTTYNAGFDFKFLKNRLTWETDIFYHKRTNMLISRNASLPEISGITLPRENLGEMENKGFETLVSWTDKIGEVQYGVTVNTTYARNKILFWDETPGIPEWQRSTGKPVDTYLFYESDGVFRDQSHVDATKAKWTGAVPGDLIFKDVNDDGVINGDDRVRRSKNTEPRFVGGFTGNLAWKNWDFMFMIQGAAGSEVYVRTWSGTVGNFLKSYYDDRWTPERPDAPGPRTYERENQYWTKVGDNDKADFFIRNGNYIRLKNIELGYNFNVTKIGISRLRLYFNANNLITLDHIKVQDPESDSRDANAYPQRRMVNFGISATF